MLNTTQIKKTLLATSIITLFSIGATSSFAEQVDAEKRTYLDPVTGEVKQATKLLSEMTDEEKAVLSNEEYKALKELEDKIKAQAAEQNKNPGGE